jgi:exodeoxyribonuclease VII large subunit
MATAGLWPIGAAKTNAELQQHMARASSNLNFEALTGVRPAGPGPLTVSQLTRMVRDTLRAMLPPVVSVVGQVSNFRPAASGHAWFTLKDDQAQLSCVMWADKVRRLKFTPQDGLEVVASGSIDVYAAQGRYQLYVERVEPVGVGALELAFRQLYEKLLKEGLFDASHKKLLPRYPGTIAIVTSPTGAAIRDIVRTILRRWPAIRLIVVPVRVQGEKAVDDIVQAIRRINAVGDDFGIDLMIVGRGGGSIEDLWAFNEEAVARAIFASRIPIISAVGHERDTTIADLVADVRAATPTHAGEIAVRVLNEVQAELDDQAEQLRRQMADRLEWHRLRLQSIQKEPCIADPAGQLRLRGQDLDRLGWGIQSRVQRLLAGQTGRLAEIRLRMQRVHPDVQLTRARTRLEETAARLPRAAAAHARLKVGQLDAMQARLEASNPRQVLQRGFTITRNVATGRLITAAGHTRPGMTIATETARGECQSVVNPAGHAGGGASAAGAVTGGRVRPRKQSEQDTTQLTLPMDLPPEDKEAPPP